MSNCQEQNKNHDLVKINEFEGKCNNCDLKISIIPKDCVVCDSCNKGMSNEYFVSNGLGYWYEDFLYCGDCHEQYGNDRDPKTLKMKILEGDDLSNTELANQW